MRYGYVLGVVVLAAGVARAQGVEARLAAASVPLADGRIEVRLRWPVTKGWLPEGGFRLYRGEGERAQQIFPKPPPALKIDKTKLFRPDVLQLKAATLKGGPDLGVALTRAATLSRSTDAPALFEPRTARAASSESLFGPRARTLKQRVLDGPFALRARALGQDDEPAELKGYWERIRGEALRIRALTPRAPQPDDAVVQSRSDLMISAITRPDVAAKLGIAAVDTVARGEKLEYRLVAVDAAGKETPVSTLTFIAGENPPPPALAGLKAEQVGDGQVALRWERPGEELMQRLGAVGYKMFRVDGRSPQGKPLTDEPFFVTEIPAQGGSVEPIAFYTDDEAAIGPATYRVVAIDMFGRETPPTSVSVNIEDLRPAAPPVLAQAALEKGPGKTSVRVVWKKSATEGARYHIWRRDAEVAGSEFVKLTTESTPGMKDLTRETLRALVGRGLDNQLFGSGPGVGLPPGGPGGGKLLLDPKTTNAGGELIGIPPITQIDKVPPGGGVIRPGEFLLPPDAVGKLPIDLSLVNAYLDSTAQPDHKYIYAVTAVLPGSRAESAFAETRTVVYPAPPPAAPVVQTPVYKKGMPATIKLASFRPAGALPITPKGKLRAATLTQNRAELRWSAPSGQSGLRYHVYRSALASPGPDDWEFRGEATTTTFADALPPARALTYHYRVDAINRWEATSPPGKTVFNAPPTIPPSTPEVVSVRPDAQGRLAIRVRQAPVEEGVARLRVFRKLVKPLTVQLTEPLFAKALRSREAGLASRGEEVVDAEGEPKAVSERPGVAGGLRARSGGALTISTRDLPESKDGYAEVNLTASSPDASGTVTLTDGGVKVGETYFYRVVAETADGLRSDESEPLGAQAAPPRELPGISGLTASIAPDGVALRWSASSGASAYVVVRTAISGGRPRTYRVAATSWTDRTAQAGVAYRYSVRSVGPGGGLSPEALATITLPVR